MRHVKAALGLAAAVCLFGTLTAPALAHEFTTFKYKSEASEATPFTLNAKNPEETQFKFVFSKYKLKCLKGIGKGPLTSGTATELGLHLALTKCGFYPFSTEEHIPAVIRGGIGMKFKVNGAVETEGNGEGEELEYGTKLELLETAATFSIPAGKFCKVIVPTQVIPVAAIKKPGSEYSAAVYSNEAFPVEETPQKLKMFPGYLQHKVLITLDLKGVKFRFGEETQCNEDEPKEQGTGTITGELLTEVVNGNIEFH
ncbi:MAG TPA: hypothetical protein VKG82_02950 [Solirubrobacteraceae bacterium]|nr:hypothetical protein [Solirubrobacteraceae bacterium]